MRKLLLVLLLLALSTPSFAMDLKVFNSGDPIKASDFNDLFSQIDSATNGAFTNEELYGEWSCEKINANSKCFGSPYYSTDSSGLFNSLFFSMSFRKDSSVANRNYISMSVDPSSDLCANNAIQGEYSAWYATKGDALITADFQLKSLRYHTISKVNKDKFIFKLDNYPEASTIICERKTKAPNAPEFSFTESDLANGNPCQTANIAQGQMCIFWSDKSSNEDGFIVYRKTGNDGSFAEVGRTGENVNYYVGPLAPGSSYYYVKAYNKYGESAPSGILATQNSISQ